jgi:hypothetical protein
LASAYPTIARWASGYGWVEFGIDGLDRPFARAVDEGGTVWEGEGQYETLDEALGDMEEGLARFMEEEGFIKKPSARPKTPQRSDEKARKSKGKSVKEPHRPDLHPVARKVKNLEEIAKALRRGEGFSVTRLTTIKRLCEDAEAAGAESLYTFLLSDSAYPSAWASRKHCRRYPSARTGSFPRTRRMTMYFCTS